MKHENSSGLSCEDSRRFRVATDEFDGHRKLLCDCTLRYPVTSDRQIDARKGASRRAGGSAFHPVSRPVELRAKPLRGCDDYTKIAARMV